MGLDIKPLRHVRDYGMLRLAMCAEAAELFSSDGGSLQGGMIGSAIAGVGLTTVGVQHLRDAVRDRCVEGVLEGSSAVVLGLHGCTHAIYDAGELMQAHGLSVAGHTLHPVLTALGLISGSLDLAIGAWQFGREMEHGRIHADGLLTMGLGTATIAAALGGGLPATIFATLFLAGRTALHETSATPHTPHLGSGWHILSR